MNLTYEALESEVLRLPSPDRTRLLDRVVASLDTDTQRDAAWDAVAAKRDAEIENDPSVAVPLDRAIARLRAGIR